jgi:hypothetical protein
MKVEELVGSRVWVKSDQFSSVSDVISSVQAPVNVEPTQVSVAESTFKVSLTSGDVVELSGTEIAKVDHDGSRDLLE